jgi:hypothetical protein
MENLADKTIIYGILQSDQRKLCKGLIKKIDYGLKKA